MFQWNDEDSRRRFLLRVGVQEPFAWLPQGVWRNARMSGLIMIHRPTPPLLTWRTQIAGNEYCGENRKEYPPRLYGRMKTDRDGRFELHTIRSLLRRQDGTLACNFRIRAQTESNFY